MVRLTFTPLQFIVTCLHRLLTVSCFSIPSPRRFLATLESFIVWCEKMKHETILDISITFKTCWTCLHDVFGTKAHVQRSLSKCLFAFLDASYPREKETPTFYVNLHENATSVGYLTQLLLLDPEKRKNVNISTLQSVKLLNYLYGNEFEGCNILRISQICPKFAKFCTRNVTLIWLTVKPIYIIFRSLVRTI